MDRALPEGRMTLLFTDIEGSTRLLRQLGGGYDTLLADHFSILRASLRAHGGIEVSTEGDAVFAVFRSAAAAVAACVEAQRALLAHPWPTPGGVRVRMGLHTGEVRRAGPNYVGLAVHQAARVSNAANGGQVLCTASTAGEAEGALAGDVRLLPLGVFDIRDFDEGEGLYQVTADGLEVRFPAVRALPAGSHSLPFDPTSFVGRETELAELAQLLDQHPVVTVLGAGGAGKTRLALELARREGARFSDGVTAVLLAPVDDPGLVAVELADAVGVPEGRERSVEARIVAALRERHTLIVLDNCEHVVEAAADLVHAIQAGTHRARVVATSRRPLGVPGERVYALGPLTVPDDPQPSATLLQSESVRLFVERATAADPTFRLDAARGEEVARICRRLDGLPLAIELAVARLRSMSVSTLAARIDDTVRLLTSGPRSVADRQRTVQSLVDWSHRLITEEEAVLFRRLAVFRGADLEAVEAVCGAEPLDPADILELLDGLVSHSLVEFDGREDGRYRMLSVVRDVAAAHLDAAGEASDLRRRHLARFTAVAAETTDLLHQRRSPDAARMRGDADNLRVALAWALRADGDREGGAALAVTLSVYWFWLGMLSEGRRWLEEALASTQGRRRVAVLGELGRLASAQGDVDAADAWFEEGARLARSLEDLAGLAACTGGLGLQLASRGLWGEAMERYGEARRISRRLGDVDREVHWLGNLAHAERARDRPDAAAALWREAVGVARAAGDRQREAHCLMQVASLAIAAGDLAAATSEITKAREMARALGDPATESIAAALLGRVAEARGDDEAAARAYDEAIALGNFRGDRLGAGWLPHRAEVARRAGDRGLARLLYEDGLARARLAEHAADEAACLAGLAGLDAPDGDAHGDHRPR